MFSTILKLWSPLSIIRETATKRAISTVNANDRTAPAAMQPTLMSSRVERNFWQVCRVFSIPSLVMIGIFTAGCCSCPKPEPSTRPVIHRVTESMAIVLQKINNNSVAVPSIWTQLDYTADIVNPEKKRTEHFSGDGDLMFKRPGSLLMVGNKDVVGRVFELGVNEQQFWVKMRKELNGWNYWWGNNANLGKPCCQPIPVDPGTLVQVLGVSVYGTDFLQRPVPVMRYDPVEDSYVFDFNDRVQDRWFTAKEVWYNAGTFLPTKVVLYDLDGRPVLVAGLTDHAPAEVPGTPKENWPIVARSYDLAFPATGSHMTITFNNPATSHPLKRGSLPGPHSFDRPDPDDNNAVIQVDKACAGDGV